MKIKFVLVALSLMWVVPGKIYSQENVAQLSPAEEAVHNELRALRDGVVEAINKGDLDRMLSYLHPNVVMTAPDANVSRNREELKSYVLSKTSGPGHIVKSFDCTVEVDELTRLYGNTGISFGSASQHFVLTTGMEFTAKTRWSAALVKENGKWLITSLHSSANLFDNPLLTFAKRTAYWVGAIASIIGLIIGFLLGRRRRKVA